MSTTAPAKTILIGDLLVKSGMTTPRNMADAVPISLKTGLPIGRVLIGASALTEAHLQQALLAQSLIRDSLLSLDLAVQALHIVHKEGFNLEQALNIVGWQRDSFTAENKLGQLLLQAEAITQEQLDQCLHIFYSAGLPLARVLVLKGTITNLVAYVALTSQQMLRDNKITRDQAVQAVQAAKASRAVIEQDYIDGYLRLQPGNNIRIGEIMVRANLITEDALIATVEQAIQQGITLGEALVERGLISQDTLGRTLEAQRLVTEMQLDIDKAGILLRQADRDRVSIKEIMSYNDFNKPEPQFGKQHQAKITHQELKPVPFPTAVPEADPARMTHGALARRRSHEEGRARELVSRLQAKLDAINTRNKYLGNVLDANMPTLRITAESNQPSSNIESGFDFDSSIELIERLFGMIETSAYRNGYLLSRVDTASAHSTLLEKVHNMQAQIDEYQRKLQLAEEKWHSSDDKLKQTLNKLKEAEQSLSAPAKHTDTHTKLNPPKLPETQAPEILQDLHSRKTLTKALSLQVAQSGPSDILEKLASQTNTNLSSKHHIESGKPKAIQTNTRLRRGKNR